MGLKTVKIELMDGSEYEFAPLSWTPESCAISAILERLGTDNSPREEELFDAFIPACKQSIKRAGADNARANEIIDLIPIMDSETVIKICAAFRGRTILIPKARPDEAEPAQV